MDEKSRRIAELIKKHLQETLTEAERVELEAWLDASPENRPFFNRFEDKAYVARELELMSRADTEVTLSSTLATLGVEKKPLPRLVWKKYAVAAAILLAIVTGGYLWRKASHAKTTEVANAPAAPVQDAAPGGDKAILTLADGSQIVLDSAANGTLAQQGRVNVLKLNGQLKYSAGQGVADNSAAMAYNTVHTPRGGQYQLVLQDGTKVWLNAASTFKFPAAFPGNERKVELTGEGYFEVTKSKLPFKVLVPGGQEVEVLGTHFNVMAYKDEPIMRTTLLEGRVQVRPANNDPRATANDQRPTLLSPGQQAQLSASGKILVDENANIEQAVAWKNGMQYFKDADLHTILRQVSRWYNVDVEYKAEGPEMGLNGTIPRNFSLQNMLKVLQLNNDQLHLKFENGIITVLP